MSETRLTESERERLIEAIQDGNEVEFVERLLANRLADRDAAGVEALGMVSGLLMAYGDESSDEFLVHQLRAALSGPGDEHPADGTDA